MSKSVMEAFVKAARDELAGHSGPNIAQTLAILAVAAAMQNIADALDALDSRDRMRFQQGK